MTTISAAVCGVNYRLEWIGSSEGLPQADVKSIATDGKGLLWISTNDGLARYNGKEFTPIAISNDVMPTIQVRAVVSDPNGDIWVGSLGSGLFVYDTSVERFVAVTSEVGYIYDIAVDSYNDAVWLAGRDGALHRITGSSSVIERLRSGEKIEQISHYTIDEVAKKGNITQLTTDRSGAVVALRNKSAYRYNSEKDNFEEYLPKVLHNVTCTAQYGDYTLFVRNKRLFSYDHSDGDVVDMNVDDVNRLYVSSRGELWIFCSDGVLLKELGTAHGTTLEAAHETTLEAAHGTTL
ncbi:MAG: two-component regulator propeller domain-containing protein, partial [Rikenellaceae bacterium]